MTLQAVANAVDRITKNAEGLKFSYTIQKDTDIKLFETNEKLQASEKEVMDLTSKLDKERTKLDEVSSRLEAAASESYSNVRDAILAHFATLRVNSDPMIPVDSYQRVKVFLDSEKEDRTLESYLAFFIKDIDDPKSLLDKSKEDIISQINADEQKLKNYKEKKESLDKLRSSDIHPDHLKLILDAEGNKNYGQLIIDTTAEIEELEKTRQYVEVVTRYAADFKRLSDVTDFLECDSEPLSVLIEKKDNNVSFYLPLKSDDTKPAVVKGINEYLSSLDGHRGPIVQGDRNNLIYFTVSFHDYETDKVADYVQKVKTSFPDVLKVAGYSSWKTIQID